MNKKTLIEYLGGTCEKAALRLGYTHRNNVQRLANPLTARQVQTITMRMKAKRIKIPSEWNTSLPV